MKEGINKLIKRSIKITCFIVLTIVAVISLAILGLYCYMNVQGNVLDRIKRNEGSLHSFRQTEAFNLKSSSWDYETYDFMGFLTLRYKKEYLEKNCYIGIEFTKDSDLLIIQNFRILSENEHLSLSIRYDYKEKVLIYEPIMVYVSTSDTEIISDKERIEKYLKKYAIMVEDIREYQNYALYDVILKTWVKGNGGNYEREKKKLQKCTIVDKTFEYDQKELSNE